MKKNKTKLIPVERQMLEKPFTTEFTQFMHDKIIDNIKQTAEYDMEAHFRECLFPFVADIYSRILSEFYLENNPAMKDFVHTFSKRTMNYMFNAFKYYFNIPLIYNYIEEGIQSKGKSIKEVSTKRLLEYLDKYTSGLVNMYVFEVILFISNTVYESLYTILICELNSSDFELVANTIAPIINDFIPTLQETTKGALTNAFITEQVVR